MPSYMSKTLLPAGLMDVLPPEASFEADTVERIVGSFLSNGYQRVKPPLIEFEDGLLSGSGASLDIANQTFRMMDPVSQKMLGVRPDMTIQVARIASSRLSKEPRPLRLSYSGSVLRVKGSQLRPARQFTQAGAELIGEDCASADAEIIEVACASLQELGINDITVDLNIPTLVPALCKDYDLDEYEFQNLREALNQKDINAAKTALENHVELYQKISSLMETTGTQTDELEKVANIKLPQEAKEIRDRLVEVVEVIKEESPNIKMTIDLVENRGFEYHTGVSFSLFSSSYMSEIGRGGRYIVGDSRSQEDQVKKKIKKSKCEHSTGVTLFLDSIMKIIKTEEENKKVFVPKGFSSSKEVVELIKKGFVVIRGLKKTSDDENEARRMKCRYLLTHGQIKELS